MTVLSKWAIFNAEVEKQKGTVDTELNIHV